MPVTRRNFLKGALALAGSGMGGALSVPALMTLLPPPVVRCNPDEAYDSLLYKRREPGAWYEPMAGKVVRKEDFKLNQAAMVTWAPKELEEALGACYIIITVAKVSATEEMAEWGVSDDSGDTMLMAYNSYKCTHHCCRVEWVEEGDSPLSGEDYEHQLVCPCHSNRYDPESIVEDSGEDGRTLIGAEWLEGAGGTALPLIPLAERGGALVGRTHNLEWLNYCGLGS